MKDFLNAFRKIKVEKKELEFRLYYDKESGNPLYYSMENLEGDYIVVPQHLYIQASMNLKVKNGEIEFMRFKDISKLTPHGNDILCHENDISLVTEKGTGWSLRRYDN